MIFLSLIAVLAIVHFTTFGAVLQRDAWFVGLLTKLRVLPPVLSTPALQLFLALVIPLMVLILCILMVLHYGFSVYLFFVYVPVLLYSLGRGDFASDVNNYINVAMRSDSLGASKLIDELRGRVDLGSSVIDTDDWKSLHTQALKVMSYRSFERTFAVLFWFVIAGAVGALLYRLSVIYRENAQPHSVSATLAEKWLWLLELPAVRFMGLTWAFVGNFDSCPWRDSLLDTENSSITILNNSLRGALSAPTDIYRHQAQAPSAAAINETAEQAAEAFEEANENAQEVMEDLVGMTLSPQAEPAYSFALVKSILPLYSRSLLFCVGVIAFATLFI